MAGDEWAGPNDRVPGDPALAVDTVIAQERGRWVVHIVVVFADGVVRRTVNDYPTRRHAEIAAGWIGRAAAREVQNPREPGSRED